MILFIPFDTNIFWGTLATMSILGVIVIIFRYVLYGECFDLEEMG